MSPHYALGSGFEARENSTGISSEPVPEDVLFGSSDTTFLPQYPDVGRVDPVQQEVQDAKDRVDAKLVFSDVPQDISKRLRRELVAFLRTTLTEGVQLQKGQNGNELVPLVIYANQPQKLKEEIARKLLSLIAWYKDILHDAQSIGAEEKVRQLVEDVQMTAIVQEIMAKDPNEEFLNSTRGYYGLRNTVSEKYMQSHANVSENVLKNRELLEPVSGLLAQATSEFVDDKNMNPMSLQEMHNTAKSDPEVFAKIQSFDEKLSEVAVTLTMQLLHKDNFYFPHHPHGTDGSEYEVPLNAHDETDIRDFLHWDTTVVDELKRSILEIARESGAEIEGDVASTSLVAFLQSIHEALYLFYTKRRFSGTILTGVDKGESLQESKDLVARNDASRRKKINQQLKIMHSINMQYQRGLRTGSPKTLRDGIESHAFVSKSLNYQLQSNMHNFANLHLVAESTFSGFESVRNRSKDIAPDQPMPNFLHTTLYFANTKDGHKSTEIYELQNDYSRGDNHYLGHLWKAEASESQDSPTQEFEIPSSYNLSGAEKELRLSPTSYLPLSALYQREFHAIEWQNRAARHGDAMRDNARAAFNLSTINQDFFHSDPEATFRVYSILTVRQKEVLERLKQMKIPKEFIVLTERECQESDLVPEVDAVPLPEDFRSLLEENKCAPLPSGNLYYILPPFDYDDDDWDEEDPEPDPTINLPTTFFEPDDSGFPFDETPENTYDPALSH